MINRIRFVRQQRPLDHVPMQTIRRIGKVNLRSGVNHHEPLLRIGLIRIYRDLNRAGSLSVPTCCHDVRLRVFPEAESVQQRLVPVEAIVAFGIAHIVIGSLMREVIRKIEALVPHPILT